MPELTYFKQTHPLYREYKTVCRGMSYDGSEEGRQALRAAFPHCQFDHDNMEKAGVGLYINNSEDVDNYDLAEGDGYVIELLQKGCFIRRSYISIVNGLYNGNYRFEKLEVDQFRTTAAQGAISSRHDVKEASVLATRYDGTIESLAAISSLLTIASGDDGVGAPIVDGGIKIDVDWVVTLTIDGGNTLFSKKECIVKIGDWIVFDADYDLICVTAVAWGKYKFGDSHNPYVGFTPQDVPLFIAPSKMESAKTAKTAIGRFIAAVDYKLRIFGAAFEGSLTVKEAQHKTDGTIKASVSVEWEGSKLQAPTTAEIETIVDNAVTKYLKGFVDGIDVTLTHRAV